MNSDLVAGVGELEICNLCDSSPHSRGCPRHAHFSDERVIYRRADVPDDVGPASYWVEETYVAAALDAGVDEHAALIEGIAEFDAALKRGELLRV